MKHYFHVAVLLFGSIIGGVLSQPALGWVHGALAQLSGPFTAGNIVISGPTSTQVQDSSNVSTTYASLPSGLSLSRVGTPTVAGQDTVGLFTSTTNNTASTPGYGNRFNWQTDYLGSGGFEIGVGFIGNIQSITTGVTGSPQYLLTWSPLVGPKDTADHYAIMINEGDIGFQGSDLGWSASRASLAQWAVGYQVGPAQNFGNGTLQNALADFVAVPDPQATHKGAYNGFLCDYNPSTGWSSIAPTGYCIYGTGDNTGTVGNYPAAPLGFAGNWLHGIQLLNSTFNDNVAMHLATAHVVEWDDGTAVSSIGQNGSGASVGLNFVTAGSGTLSVNGTAGLSCSGTPSSSFASVNGIVTHC